MRDDRERLADILDSIKQIEKYAFRGFEAFSQDELIQVWCLHWGIIENDLSPLRIQVEAILRQMGEA